MLYLPFGDIRAYIVVSQEDRRACQHPGVITRGAIWAGETTALTEDIARVERDAQRMSA